MYVLVDSEDSKRDIKSETMMDIFDYIKFQLGESFAWVTQPEYDETVVSKCGRYQLNMRDGRSVRNIRLFTS